MPYSNMDEFLACAYQNSVEDVIAMLDDEQKWQLAQWAGIGGNGYAEDVQCKVDYFIHHCIEGTDMASEYTILEQVPERFEGIPDKGKVHDAVYRIAGRAYLAGIEHAVNWMLEENKVYDWER